MNPFSAHTPNFDAIVKRAFGEVIIDARVISNKFEEFFDKYQSDSNSSVNSKSDLDDLLRARLENRNIDPTERLIIQFVLDHKNSSFELANSVNEATVILGNGSASKNKLQVVLFTDTAGDQKSPDQAKANMVLGKAHQDGVNLDSNNLDSKLRNTLIIQSANEKEGLESALKHYQKAADLGHTEAAAKVEEVQGLISLLSPAMLNLAATVTDNTADSDSDERAAKNKAEHNKQVADANYKAKEEQMEVLLNKQAIFAEHRAVKTVENEIEAAMNVERQVANIQQHKNQTAAAAA